MSAAAVAEFRRWVWSAFEAGPLRAGLRGRGYDERCLCGLSDDELVALVAEVSIEDEIGPSLEVGA
jgi:hypothetical protein